MNVELSADAYRLVQLIDDVMEELPEDSPLRAELQQAYVLGLKLHRHFQ